MPAHPTYFKFQSIMNEILGDLPYVLIYIDDVLCLQERGKSANDYLKKLETILGRLEKAGFRANLQKSFFMQKEVEYLGYQLTSKGLKPQPKKLEAINQIVTPTNPKQLKRFIRMIIFYRDIWEKRSHILAPLTKLAAETSKSKDLNRKKTSWKWEKEPQDAFDEAKKMIKLQAKQAFPDWKKPFHLCSDASDVQLGTTLVQEGRPLGFYTRKMNAAQLNYTVEEKELLGIVEGMKAFKGMIRVYNITIHTDHLNLLYKKLSNQRMLRWRLLLEDFNPTVKHIAGEKNLSPDTLSRLEMTHKDHNLIKWEPPKEKLKYTNNDSNHKLVMWMNSLEFKPGCNNKFLYELT